MLVLDFIYALLFFTFLRERLFGFLEIIREFNSFLLNFLYVFVKHFCFVNRDCPCLLALLDHKDKYTDQERNYNNRN
jgi:hypothetical protein